MNATITIAAPPSKSLSHRALICAALAPGTSSLHNILQSEDLERTTACLQMLGARIEAHDLGTVRVTGTSGPKSREQILLDVGESGTTCRLLAGVASAFPGVFLLRGQGRMHQRPIKNLTQALNTLGVQTEFPEHPDCPPLVLRSQGLRGGHIRVNLEQSSQFLSALLLSAPLAREETCITLEGAHIASWPYVALTLDMMRAFGASIVLEVQEESGWRQIHAQRGLRIPPAFLRFRVHPGTYQSQDFTVEGDWSSASYFLAAGAVGQAPVCVTGLRRDSLQADAAILDILASMGARTAWNTAGTAVTVFPSSLRGITYAMQDCPDIVPTVAALATFARGETLLTGAAHLRLKESDRIQAPATELCAAGALVTPLADGLRILGQKPLQKTVNLCTHADHRMAMSLSLLELAGTVLTLDNSDCVRKSFPEFWKYWELVRAGNASRGGCAV